MTWLREALAVLMGVPRRNVCAYVLVDGDYTTITWWWRTYHKPTEQDVLDALKNTRTFNTATVVDISVG